jgi:hypothetical protein
MLINDVPLVEMPVIPTQTAGNPSVPDALASLLSATSPASSAILDPTPSCAPLPPIYIINNSGNVNLNIACPRNDGSVLGPSVTPWYQWASSWVTVVLMLLAWAGK